MVQARRDKAAARKLMRKLLKKQGIAPTEWVTDKYRVYGSVLRDLGTSPHSHVTGKRSNNRAESSHVPVRRRERKLQRFKSPASAQRLLSLHAATYNVFTLARHLTTARTHRLLARLKSTPHVDVSRASAMAQDLHPMNDPGLVGSR